AVGGEARARLGRGGRGRVRGAARGVAARPRGREGPLAPRGARAGEARGGGRRPPGRDGARPARAGSARGDPGGPPARERALVAAEGREEMISATEDTEDTEDLLHRSDPRRRAKQSPRTRRPTSFGRGRSVSSVSSAARKSRREERP